MCKQVHVVECLFVCLSETVLAQLSIADFNLNLFSFFKDRFEGLHVLKRHSCVRWVSEASCSVTHGHF